jgi:DNA-binding transcriptional MocR family regulator
MMSDAVSRMQELLLILGRTTARKKVGSFLLKMMERCSRQPADRVLLPTSRYDIADYLALSVETVSRSLTELKHRGLIALAGPRRVQIVDRHGLEDEIFRARAPWATGSIRSSCSSPLAVVARHRHRRSARLDPVGPVTAQATPFGLPELAPTIASLSSLGSNGDHAAARMAWR